MGKLWMLPFWGLVLLGAPKAWAETTPSSDGKGRFAVGLSASLGLAFGRSRPALVSDTSIERFALPLAGLHLSPRWRGGKRWALGLWGGLTTHVTSKAGATDLWDFQAEARWYPAGDRTGPRELWLAASAGWVVAVDHVQPFLMEFGELRPAHTFISSGPCGSLGIGFDGRLSRFLAIGPEVRAVVLGMNTAKYPIGAPIYKPMGGLTIGLTVTVQTDGKRAGMSSL